MIDSYVPGLKSGAIQYVYKTLMIELDEDEARKGFTKYGYG
jgi:hypothetical protein